MNLGLLSMPGPQTASALRLALLGSRSEASPSNVTSSSRGPAVPLPFLILTRVSRRSQGRGEDGRRFHESKPLGAERPPALRRRPAARSAKLPRATWRPRPRAARGSRSTAVPLLRRRTSLALARHGSQVPCRSCRRTLWSFPHPGDRARAKERARRGREGHTNSRTRGRKPWTPGRGARAGREGADVDPDSGVR